MEISHATNRRIDPDPSAGILTACAIATVCLQLVQIYQAHLAATKGGPPVRALVSDEYRASRRDRMRRLSKIRDSALDLRARMAAFQAALIAGDRRAREVMEGRPLLIGDVQLDLDRANHAQYSHNLALAYEAAGRVSRWINEVIANDPALAVEIGRIMTTRMTDPAARLNAMLHGDGSLQQVFDQADLAIWATMEASQVLIAGL